MISGSGVFIKKCTVFWIVFFMVGTLGIFSNFENAPPNAGAETVVCATEDSMEESSVRSADGARGTVIGGYLQLWDSNQNDIHDGEYGDGDGNYYYLGTDDQYFRIYLKSIYKGQYIRYINTTLIRGSELVDIFTITSGEYKITYMSENDIRYFYYYFDIHNSVQIKAYQLSLRVEIYAIDSNGKGHEITETMTFKIHLSTRFRATGSTYNSLSVNALDNIGDIVPLYSGSRNQIVGIHHIRSATGVFTDLEFTMTPPTDFILESKVAKLDSIDTDYFDNTDPLWMLSSMGSNYEKPKEYSGTCSVSYKYYGRSINERSIKLYFEIDITPIIVYRDQIAESDIGSIKNYVYMSNYEIHQGTTSKSFSLSFKNTGNIDLKDVEVELYTDDASYFFKSQYYYDEGSHAYKRSYFKSISFGDIYMDETVTSSFPIEIVKELPPGLYKIPIRYNAKYELEGFTDIEVDMINEHIDMVAARAMDNKGYLPFLLIHVLEGNDPNDDEEPDVMAFSSTPLTVGDNNIMLTVQMTNLESYTLNSVNVQVQVGGDSPLQKLNTRDLLESWVSPIEQDFSLYPVNDPTFSNAYELHYMVDVDSNAEPGLYNVPLTVNCLDCVNNERSTITNLQLNIQPNPPRFLISEIYTSTIEPNKDFNLTLSIFNSGGSDAKNVSLMFNGSSCLFYPDTNIIGPKHINKASEMDYSFMIRTGDLDLGSKHTLSFYVTCEDCVGNVKTYDSNPKLSVPIMVKKFDPDFAPMFIISETTTTDIKPNSYFSLKVKLLNCGGSTAKNVRILFNGSSNFFFAVDNIKSLPVVLKNQEVQFEFMIKTGDVNPGGIYDSSIHVSYEDSEGKQYSFNSNPEQVITLRAEKAEPEGWKVNEGLAVLILGILILISAILIGILRSRAGKRDVEFAGPADDEDRSKNGRVRSPQTQPAFGKVKRGGLFRKKEKTMDYSGGARTAGTYTSTTPTTPTTTTTPTTYPQQSVTGSMGYDTQPQQQQQQQQQYQQYQPAQGPTYTDPTTTPYLPTGQGQASGQYQNRYQQY